MSPAIRGTFRKLIKKDMTIKDIAYFFGTTRQTVHKWLKGALYEYIDWFNYYRFHRGVKAFPVMLYECNVGKLT